LFIGGEWWVVSGGVEFEVVDFFIEEVFILVVDVIVEDGWVVFDVVVVVQVSWVVMVLCDCGEILCVVFEKIIECVEDFVFFMIFEMGKFIKEVMVEIIYGVEFFWWFFEEVVCIVGCWLMFLNGVMWLLMMK